MKKFWSKKQIAHAMPVPVEADHVFSPKVIYCDDIVSINFLTDEDRHGDDERYGRVTFPGVDAIRACRGEYHPYESDRSVEGPSNWVSTVRNSQWLLERYTYEAEHYRGCYGFGGDVDEMLTDFFHYVFSFHDEFVETLATGLWFEVGDAPFRDKELESGHPFLPLPESTVTEHIRGHGEIYEVRQNPKSEAELIENAQYCSQPLMEFAMLWDGHRLGRHSVRLKKKNERISCVLRGPLGKTIAEFDGIVTLDQIRPYIDESMARSSREA